MEKIVLFACLMASSVGAFATTDCTKMNPMRTGRPTLVADARPGNGKEALLGCNDGPVDLVMPGIGSFSWSAVQAPDFFLLLWREESEDDRRRMRNILNCLDRLATCRKDANSFLESGKNKCGDAKVTVSSSWSADGSGGSVGSSVSLERSAPKEYGRCMSDLATEVMSQRVECQIIAQQCSGM